MNSVEFYQELENPELGDINEAQGMLKLNGHIMEVGSINEVFIWCSALPETSSSVLKSLNPSYDAIVRVLDVNEFVRRIVTTAKTEGYTLHSHIEKVNYNRGEEVSKEALNEQLWHHNVFQKSPDYSHQSEYRLSFSNFTIKRIDKKHLDISLGNCNDIIEIET